MHLSEFTGVSCCDDGRVETVGTGLDGEEKAVPVTARIDRLVQRHAMDARQEQAHFTQRVRRDEVRSHGHPCIGMRKPSTNTLRTARVEDFAADCLLACVQDTLVHVHARLLSGPARFRFACR